MPHVKMKKPESLTGIWKAPPRFSLRIKGKDISFKFGNCYISTDLEEVVFKWVVAEGRLVQHIFFSLRLEEDMMILGISRNYPVLRTEGVKLLMAIIAAFLQEMGHEIVSSSLGPYIKDGSFYQKHLSAGAAGEGENLD